MNNTIFRIWYLLLGVILLALSACNHVASDKAKVNKSERVNTLDYVGLWYAPAYGIMLDVDARSHQWYQLTSEYCQKFSLEITHERVINSINVASDQLSIHTTIGDLKVPGIVMRHIGQLPDSCTTNQIVTSKFEPNYRFDAQIDFEIFWQTFQEYYAFFDIEGVDWHGVYQLANSKISQTTTESELVDILIEMVEPLKDFHVSIMNEALDIEYSESRKPSIDDLILQEFITDNQIEVPFSQQQILNLEHYLDQALGRSFQIILDHFIAPEDVKINASETLFWGILAGNVGYINVMSMELTELVNEAPEWLDHKALLEQQLEQIMKDLSEVNSVIIDVRINGGGDDFVGNMIASHFFQITQHVYSKQARLGDKRTPLQKVFVTPSKGRLFTGPVAVLTSSTTYSAAEVFAMIMAERSNTVLVGEASAGGFSDILPKSLPHGTEFSLSNEFYLTPTGDGFEGVGVPVDIQQINFSKEQREQYIDLSIEKSINWLQSQ